MSEVCGKSVKSESVKSFRSGLVFGRNVWYNKKQKRNPFRAGKERQRILGLRRKTTGQCGKNRFEYKDAI